MLKCADIGETMLLRMLDISDKFHCIAVYLRIFEGPEGVKFILHCRYTCNWIMTQSHYTHDFLQACKTKLNASVIYLKMMSYCFTIMFLLLKSCSKDQHEFPWMSLLYSGQTGTSITFFQMVSCQSLLSLLDYLKQQQPLLTTYISIKWLDPSQILVTDLSDHFGQFDIVEKMQNQSAKYQTWRETNIQRFVFTPVLTCNSPDEAYQNLIEPILVMHKKAFPLTNVKYSPNKIKREQWMTPALLKSSRTKHKTFSHKN